jgi:DNA-binding GntR family transcriptional regulator
MNEHRTLGDSHTPLRDLVREEIRQRISDGQFPPGSTMVERELATELGVSRVPVREALRTLEAEGFVHVVPRKGVIVRELSRTDVEELYDVREALEVLAAQSAAERAEPEELDALLAVLDRGDAAHAAGDTAGAQRANEEFHDVLVAIAHNELLADSLEPLQSRLHWLFRQHDNTAGLLQEHRRLYEAIASRDLDRVGAEALKHVVDNRQVALGLLFGD